MSVNTQPIYINKLDVNYKKTEAIDIPRKYKIDNLPENPNNTPDDNNSWLTKLNKRINNYSNNDVCNSNNFIIM
jgi:hypothetical protein